MKKTVKVKVPASTSNLGSGFDAVGLALKLYNEIELKISKGKPGLRIEIKGQGEHSLPHDARNLVWQAARRTFQQVGFPINQAGFHLKTVNRIPLARGLGSSGAATLSGILAADAIAGRKLSRDQILRLAVIFEGHPDNVAAQLNGGFCISVMNGKKIDSIKLDPPSGVRAVVCVPEFELSTEEARAVLPKSVPLPVAVYNVSRAALLIASIFRKHTGLFRVAMEDKLHQPFRKSLIPGFLKVVDRAYRSGAYGVALSGAGPSVFALAPANKARAVGLAMEKGFAKSHKRSKSKVLAFDLEGAQVSVR